MMNSKFRAVVRFNVLTRVLVAASLIGLSTSSLVARAQGKKQGARQPPAQDRGIRKEADELAAQRSLGLVQTLPGKTKRYALIIGVDRYDDPQVVALGGAANDARLLASALVAYAGFPADQVILLASNQPPERQPTRGNVLRKLSNLAATVPKDGLLLFSFAGHGVERNRQAFLLPADAQVSDDVNLLEQTAINVVQIRDWIRQMGVSQVLMLLDACRNDPSAGRASADNPLSRNYMRGFDFDVRNREVQAFATLYATEIGRRAYELKEKRHGYFTLALVEGLRGQAANAKGEVTLSGLVKYLQATVPQRVQLDLGRGMLQRPFAVVEGYRADELVLSVKDANKAALKLEENMPATGSDDGRAQVLTVAPPPHVEEPADDGLLAGTMWRGLSPESGEFTIEFLKDGKLNYTFAAREDSKDVLKIVKGKWRQVGATVQFSIGGFSTWQGTIESGTIKGEFTNMEGLNRNFTLLQKKQ